MHKTTVYLPDDLKRALERAAVSSGRSEADLIREGVARVAAETRPRPRGGLFSGEGEPLADRVDEMLKGFGER